MRAPPEAANMMKGVPRSGRGFEPADDGLTRRHAERTAHEIEILHRGRHRQAVEHAVSDFHRVGQIGFGARILEAIGIAALVAKFQRIDGDFGNRHVLEFAVVEEKLEARGRADAHVVIGAGNDELVGLNVLVKDELAGLRTFDPEIFRRFAPVEERPDFRPHDIGNPVH
jgi:hypothetical protein